MDLKSATVIYRVFYLTLNFVFTIYKLSENIYSSLRNKLLELCHEFLAVNRRKNFVEFDKIPRHLTVLLGSEEPSLKDISNLILWCLAARITFVSFYDCRGALKKYEEKLHRVVQQRKLASDHVIWHSNPASVYKNGYSGRKIHIKVLSEDDGKEGVADLTKKFASRSDTNVSISRFDNGLKEQFEFPDPDLGVCCGKTFSLHGYPPWQVRVTEFFTINSHHNVTFDTFVNLLYRYNTCEQRYGK